MCVRGEGVRGPGLLAGASEPEENKFDGVDGTQANIKASGSVDLFFYVGNFHAAGSDKISLLWDSSPRPPAY